MCDERNDRARDAAPADVDLDRVWTGVAAQVWRRQPGPPGAAGRPAAALAGPGQGAGDHAVAAARLAHRQRGGAGRRGARHHWHRDAVRGAARARRSRRRASPTPTGPGSIRPGSCRGAWRSATGWCCSSGRSRCSASNAVLGLAAVGRVGDRGRGHFRLADPDDRGVRAGAGGGDVSRSANVGVAAGAGRLGDHRPGRPAAAGQSAPRSPTPRSSFPTWRRRLLRRDRRCTRPGSREERHEHRDHRPDPAVRPHTGGGRGGPGGRPGVFGLLGPERRGQDLAAADDGHGHPAVRRHGCGCWTATPGARPAAGDPAPARIPAAEPRLLPGLHSGGVRRVLRAAQGDARGARFPARSRPRSSGSASATGPGPSCAPCPAACCAGSASPRRS